MKCKDVAKMKGKVKDAVQAWIEGKIDAMFPTQAATRAFLKKGVANRLAKEDVKVNKWLDTAFLFLGDEKGEIDSDVMVDNLLDVFAEMKPVTYDMGYCDVTVGGCEVTVKMPRNFLLDILTGGNDTIKFGREDFEEVKELFNKLN